MAVETRVLGSDRRIHQILRKFVITYIRPVLYMESGQNLSVFSNDLSRELAVRILKIFKRRNVCERPYGTYQKDHRSDSGSEDNPKPSYYFSFCYVCHILYFV